MLGEAVVNRESMAWEESKRFEQLVGTNQGCQSALCLEARFDETVPVFLFGAILSADFIRTKEPTFTVSVDGAT